MTRRRTTQKNQDSFRSKLRLIVDQPRAEGAKPNDENTATRFFKNSKVSAEVGETLETLMYRFYDFKSNFLRRGNKVKGIQRIRR